MSTGAFPARKERWKELSEAAFAETDPAKLKELIAAAEAAIHEALVQNPESDQALLMDDVLFALQAVRETCARERK